MKLGLLTDIHEHVHYLRKALDTMFQEQVDQIIVIGDLFETGERIEETCRLLAEAKAIGVWGNHDYDLSFEPTDEVRAKYPVEVIEYMTSLRSRLDIDGCHFTHVEPWLDPENVDDLCYYEGPPDDHRNLGRIFNAVPNRLMFAGHFHKWLLVYPTGIDGWTGHQPIRIDEGRYFVVVGAVCEGCYGIFDTSTSELVPFDMGQVPHSSTAVATLALNS